VECSDGSAVIAKIGVVVVLGDDRVAPLGPFEQRGPPLGREHDARRKLMRGCHEHGVRRGGVERSDVDALLVHRHRHGPQAAPRDDLADDGVPRVLDPDRRPARASQRAAEKADRLGEAATDERVLSGSRDAAHTAEV